MKDEGKEESESSNSVRNVRRETYDLRGDGLNGGLERLELLLVILSGSGSAELLDPILRLLHLFVNQLLVGGFKFTSETSLVSELTLQ